MNRTMSKKNQMKNCILSKSAQAKNYLLKEITSRRYSPGKCIPSDNEFSELLGLSRNTVREALSALVSEGYIERIQGKGTFVKERRAAEKSSRIITVIACDVRKLKDDDPFMGLVLRGVLSELSDLELGACLRTFGGDMTFVEYVREEGITPSMRQGIVFAGYSVTQEDVEFLKKEGIPAVSIGRPLHQDMPYVECDHFKGALQITRELIRLGHERIAFFDNVHHVASFQERRRGWMQGMNDAGLYADPRLLGQTGHFEVDRLKNEIREFLDGLDCTAIITWGDVSTFAAIEVLKEKGIKIPEGMSLYMYDGFPWVHQTAGIQITMAYSPIYELASEAGKLLHYLIEGKGSNRTKLLDIRFNEGKTVARKI